MQGYCGGIPFRISVSRSSDAVDDSVESTISSKVVDVSLRTPKERMH